MYEYKELYVVDFRNVKYWMEVHPIIRDALNFPDYYGCNLDALWDCLTEMVITDEPINILFLGIELIEEKFDDFAERMLETFQEAKHAYDDECAHLVHLYVQRGDQVIELP